MCAQCGTLGVGHWVRISGEEDNLIWHFLLHNNIIIVHKMQSFSHSIIILCKYSIFSNKSSPYLDANLNYTPGVGQALK